MKRSFKTKVCAICQSVFEPCNGNQRYCAKCGCEGGKYRKMPCVKCGKPRAYNAEHGLCKLCYHKVPEFHNFKGGSYMARGYIKTLSHNHHRADSSGYVLEHILVWEKANAKILPEDWVVHHINGDRHDNRPENLAAMPRKNHHAHLVNHVLKLKIRELETEIERLKASVKFI